MGVNIKERSSSPEQTRRDNAAFSRATLLVILAALALLIGGSFLFSLI